MDYGSVSWPSVFDLDVSYRSRLLKCPAGKVRVIANRKLRRIAYSAVI
jgi:hypothetical protein